ncbi:MAG: hypothetical protein H0X37_24685 [Herpetosiphonaceae bacterium]|nr:hypothetical protein [Herpetosiphonaceae bacterium]
MDNDHPNDINVAHRQTVLQNILQLRHQGEQLLLTSGAVPDDVLANELRAPGSDQRGGVNIVSHPPAIVSHQIMLLQQHLRTYEPYQYYYPVADLHLTVIEICSSQPLSDVTSRAARVVDRLPQAMQGASLAALSTPVVGYDARGCALNFIPTDQALASIRAQLVERLAVHGIAPAPRYPPQSAHVTFMRYVEPLRTPPERWVSVLRELACDSSLRWTLSELWVTWGATWYGNQSRIHEAGPYRIEPLRSE